MADSASAALRSTRASHQPLSLAEEQAAVTLSALEQRDIAAALRLSLQDSWDSDEEKSGAGSDAEADSSSNDEEEERKAPAAEEKEGEWTPYATIAHPKMLATHAPRAELLGIGCFASLFRIDC